MSALFSLLLGAVLNSAVLNSAVPATQPSVKLARADLELPNTVSMTPHVPYLPLVISKTEILLDGKPVLTLHNGAPTESIQDAKLPSLYRALRKHRNQEILSLWVDRETPSKTVLEVLNTCALAGFSFLRLALQGRDPKKHTHRDILAAIPFACDKKAPQGFPNCMRNESARVRRTLPPEKKPRVTFLFSVNKQGFAIEGAGDNLSENELVGLMRQIPKKDGNYDFAGLSSQARAIRLKHPACNLAIVLPHKALAYADFVLALDAIRGTGQGDLDFNRILISAWLE